MNFAESIQKSLNTNWSFINSFSVMFGGFDIDLEYEIFNDINLTEDINLNIVSINTPQFTNKEIESFIGNKWFIQNGRDELYRFDITFRDQDQMRLYNTFVKLYLYSKEQYFDVSKFSIKIYKDADWANEDDKLVMSLEDVMISSVSQLQYSNNTENQIAEFTVNFKCLTPNVY